MKAEARSNFLKPRWSKVFSDLWDNKMRTFLVVASIAVGVFSVGMIISAYVILSEEIDLNYESVSPVNIEIWTDPFSEDFVRSVIERVRRNHFKRVPPPVAKLSNRTVGYDFLYLRDWGT